METKTTKKAVSTAAKQHSAKEKLDWLVNAITAPSVCHIEKKGNEFGLRHNANGAALPTGASGTYGFGVTALSLSDLIEKAVQLDEAQKAFQLLSATILATGV